MLNRQLVKVGALMLGASLSLSACTKDNSEDIKKLSDQNAQLTKRVEALESKYASAVQTTAVPSTAPAVAASAPPEAPAAVTAAPPSVAFTDIAGVFGEQQIKDLVHVNVLAPSDKFEPAKPVSRAQFVAWLVASNNAIRQGSQAVRLAESSDTPSFSDVPVSHPLFKYIQGMSNAGWSIGYKDGTFRPNNPLTREEMIAIKTLFDRPFIPSSDRGTGFADETKIGQDFYHAWCVEGWNKLNFNRMYGQSKNCNPKKPVSRSEAAVCVWQIGYQPVVTAAAPQSKM